MAHTLRVSRPDLSVSDVCDITGITPRIFYYQAKPKIEDEFIATILHEITDENKVWGFVKCFDYIRKVLGHTWGKNPVERIYKQENLNLRIKPRKRIYRDPPAKLSVPESKNMVWSMDFMTDTIGYKRYIRTFNVIDDITRECLCMDIGISLPSSKVIKSLERAIAEYGKPLSLGCDNGPEFISHEFKARAASQAISFDVHPTRQTNPECLCRAL